MRFDPIALEALLYYSWPGEFLEARAVIDTSARLADDIIQPRHLPVEIREAGESPG
jgi:transcriptional regulator of acetoin/glycerol metabolism